MIDVVWLRLQVIWGRPSSQFTLEVFQKAGRVHRTNYTQPSPLTVSDLWPGWLHQWFYAKDVDVWACAELGWWLAEQLLPAALRADLAAYGGQHLVLAILENQPGCPWEACALTPPDVRVAFLSTSFRLCRSGSLPITSPARPQRVSFIMGQPSRAAWRDERMRLSRLAKYHGIRTGDGHADRVRLDTWGADMVHLIGHGRFDPACPDHAAFGLSEIQPLYPFQVADLGVEGRAPLVIMNSCHAGSGSLWGLGRKGWPATFLEAGAGAFVGPWTVINDGPAVEFAVALYARLFAGMALDLAVHEIKNQVVTQKQCLCFLSYAVYFGGGSSAF